MNLRIQTEPVTAETKPNQNQTYSVASAPAVTGSELSD